MTLPYYHGLLRDTYRIESFNKAIQAIVEAGDVVLEVGTGLGTYAFFAANAGAARVHAVDGLPIVHVAEAIGRQNGYEGRIVWHRGWIPGVELGERVDVIVFEDFSTRLLDADTYRVLANAYDKYLKPDGRVIPGRARLMLAPVSSDSLWRAQLPLARAEARAFGIDWTPSVEYAENTPSPVSLEATSLSAEPVELASFSLHPLPTASDLGGEAEWGFDKKTVVHGLALWFEIEVCDGVWVRNRPGPECGAWGQLFLPATEPITVEKSHVLTSRIGVHRFADGAPGWLQWEIGWAGGSLSGNEFGSDPASLDDLLAGGATTTASNGHPSSAGER